MVETMSDHDDAPEGTKVELRLEGAAYDLLIELMRRTGWDASELVGWALGAYWRELGGIVLPPPDPQEDIEKAIAEGEDDVRAGRTHSHEDVFARIAAKHGW